MRTIINAKAMLIRSMIILLTCSAVTAQIKSTDDTTKQLIPILGNYQDTTIRLCDNVVIAPSGGAANIARINLRIPSTFRGLMTVNNTSGAIQVTNAHPAGIYPITVRASDFAGITLTRTFNLTVQAQSSCNALSFGSLNPAVGSLPESIAVGDFNGDGNQDIVTANSGSNNVSVLLGTGLGTFGPAMNFPVRVTPRSVVVGDFNGDSRQDLAVANAFTGDVTVLLGNGSGSFLTESHYAVGSSPIAIAVGDYNGDGKQDLAVVNKASNSVSILLRNSANSGFTTETTITVGTSPQSIAAADFNNDGKLDLAVVNAASSTVSILRRNASNDGFTIIQTLTSELSNPSSAVAGDFNLSATSFGRPDLIVANLDSANISLFPTITGGVIHSVATSFTAGAQPYSIAAGDFNGDQFPDVITANPVSNNVSILTSDGSSGSFAVRTSFPVGSNPYSVAVGDFNGDGRQDFVTANRGSNDVSVVLRNATNDGFTTNTTLQAGTSPSAVAVGDFNADGQQDLVISNNLSKDLSIYLGTNGGNFNSPVSFPLTYLLPGGGGGVGQLPPAGITVGDFNGDGRQDLAVVGDVNTLLILLGNGLGSFTTLNAIPLSGSQVSSVAPGDFNNDGRQDLVIYKRDTSLTLLLRNNTNTDFDPPVNYNPGILSQTAGGMAVSDFNNDGKLDVAITESFNSRIWIFPNNGTGGFSTPMSISTSPNCAPVSLTSGDFNGDGNADLGAGCASSVDVFINNGTGGFFAPINYAGAGGRAITVGDFNGDGRQDLAVVYSAPGSHNLSVLLRNAANNGFEAPVNFAVGDTPRSMAVGDFNKDGRQDIAVGNASSNNVSILFRTCNVNLAPFTLANGYLGQPYNQVITAAGGTNTYSFTIDNPANLPPGLTFSSSYSGIQKNAFLIPTDTTATLTGVPTQPGNYSFRISVSDGAGNGSSNVYNIRVFAPTAAFVTLGGKVSTASGRSIGNALVTLTNSNGEIRAALTNQFGNYRFSDVQAGETYVLTVNAKGYQFSQTTQVLTVIEERSDLNFVAETENNLNSETEPEDKSKP